MFNCLLWNFLMCFLCSSKIIMATCNDSKRIEVLAGKMPEWFFYFNSSLDFNHYRNLLLWIEKSPTKKLNFTLKFHEKILSVAWFSALIFYLVLLKTTQRTKINLSHEIPKLYSLWNFTQINWRFTSVIHGIYVFN